MEPYLGLSAGPGIAFFQAAQNGNSTVFFFMMQVSRESGLWGELEGQNKTKVENQ
jgi:hypothetical protein